MHDKEKGIFFEFNCAKCWKELALKLVTVFLAVFLAAYFGVYLMNHFIKSEERDLPVPARNPAIEERWESQRK